MSSRWLAAALAVSKAMSSQAQHDDHAAHEHHRPSDAQIVVTINPEARVSAVIGAPLPAPQICGSPLALNIKVINQGFVTAPLRAAIAGDHHMQVTLVTDDAKLSGAREENRLLALTAQGSAPVDVTIAFSIDDTIGDLAGRDRVHLLIHCQPAPT